jgi:salicylate hydroxylase
MQGSESAAGWPDMTDMCDVAIVGGGIGGLTLAASLLRQSVSVRVFEQDDELREIGAGIAIGGNASRLLRRLGIDLTDVANEPPTLEVRSWQDGAPLWSQPLARRYRQDTGAPFLTLHRLTLQRFLAAAVSPAHIRLGHRLVRLSDEPAGVRLHFANGNDLIARIVVGADGARSTVRRYICGEVMPRHSGEIGFRGIIPAGKAPDLPSPVSLHIWCGPGTHAVFYGLDEGKTINLLLVYSPSRLPDWVRSSNRAPATRDQALATFAAYSWDRRILDLVRNIEGDMNLWALADLPRLPRWSRGRVVLLGDAAHAPLPHQGQGAGLAIEDAYTLGALAGTRGLSDYRALFESFGNLRRRRAWRVQAYSRIGGRVYKLTGDAAARRDQSWASLPERIRWIHRHDEAALALSGVGGELAAAASAGDR